MSYLLIQGDALRLPLANGSVHCCVTSPPYWGLRDYGTARWEGGSAECDHKTGRDKSEASTVTGGQFHMGSEGIQSALCRKCGARRIDSQLGLESTPEEYVAKMVAVFREVWRVLRSDGCIFVNLGDTYGPGKQLIGVPWRVAFAIQSDGWILRSEITWCKTSPMPESCQDRPTSATEKLFLFAKSPTYFYDIDAVRVPSAPATIERDKSTRITNGKDGAYSVQHDHETPSHPGGRNLWNYWVLSSEAFSGAHFATFPRKLVEPCIKAGTSERGCCPVCGAPWERSWERNGHRPTGHGDSASPKSLALLGNQKTSAIITRQYVNWKETGWQPTCPHDAKPVPCTVFDPFAGSGTTLVVANALGRRGIGCDLSREYLDIARRRITRPHASPLRTERAGETHPLFDRSDP